MDEGFSDARVLAEVSLLPDKIRISSGRRPVAMAAGVVDRGKPEQKPKKVLVVVTSGWSVMCFDHNLKKLWENNLQVRTTVLIHLYVRINQNSLLLLIDRKISHIMLIIGRSQS